MENEDVRDYGNTEFQNKCEKLLNEISITFKRYKFIDVYLRYINKEISIKDVENFIYKKISELNEYDRHDLNQMHAMLSKKNCWYIEYDIGNILHKQLIKFWYK